MQLAISTTFDYQLRIGEQLALLQRSGFDSISLGAQESHSGYLNQVDRGRLLTLVREHELTIDSLHVPIRQGYDLSKSDPEPRMAAVCRVALCMASATELQCSTVILHLSHFPPVPYDQQLEPLLHSLDALIESAENMKINLAAENLYDDNSLFFLRRALEQFDSERFGLCYDSSHDLLSGKEPYKLLEEFSDRLMAVHLSDNDGDEDRHWIPFTGIANWERISGILKQSEFAGPLLLEVENSANADPEKFLLDASVAGDRLREMIVG